jgi:hypothetical protein
VCYRSPPVATPRKTFVVQTEGRKLFFGAKLPAEVLDEIDAHITMDTCQVGTHNAIAHVCRLSACIFTYQARETLYNLRRELNSASAAVQAACTLGAMFAASQIDRDSSDCVRLVFLNEDISGFRQNLIDRFYVPFVEEIRWPLVPVCSLLYDPVQWWVHDLSGSDADVEFHWTCASYIMWSWYRKQRTIFEDTRTVVVCTCAFLRHISSAHDLNDSISVFARTCAVDVNTELAVNLSREMNLVAFDTSDFENVHLPESRKLMEMLE